jgi:hypothetical protein
MKLLKYGIEKEILIVQLLNVLGERRGQAYRFIANLLLTKSRKLQIARKLINDIILK